MPRPTDPILRCSVAGIDLATPIVLAAGTAGVLDEMADVIDLSRVGGVVTKSITRRPREGNPTWRVVPHEAGMLNAIGLANPGLVRFLADHAPRAASVPCAVIASVAGFSIDDYAQTVAGLAAVAGVRAVELNVSCPNVHGGTEFGADPGALRELLQEVRPLVSAHGKRLFVKLSPITVGTPHSIVTMASTAIDRGADALCLCNTIPAMAIDVETRRPILANVTGGLSGTGVHPVVVKLVHDVYRRVARDARVPIIAIGGVRRWQHAAEFMLAGAAAVQMGAMLLADPRSPLRVASGLARWARRQGFDSIGAAVGAAQLEPR